MVPHLGFQPRIETVPKAVACGNLATPERRILVPSLGFEPRKTTDFIKLQPGESADCPVCHKVRKGLDCLVPPVEVESTGISCSRRSLCQFAYRGIKLV